MAFKFALLAAVCIAQPLEAFRERNGCKNPAFAIPYEFEKTVYEMDKVRESVSMAAMDAYARDQDLEVVIACFREQKENFEKLGEHIYEMMNEASQELADKLGEKADKYAKLLEEPMRNIAVTLRALPEKVYNFIKDKEFSKAAQAMREAYQVVSENSRVIAQIMKDMATEVPELAERAEELAREIRMEARKGCEAIARAIHKCIEEGGPKKSSESSQE